jgi:acyl carrier protein
VNDEATIKSQLRQWLSQKSGVSAERLKDDLPLFEQRILSSLHVVELLGFMDGLRGQSIEIEQLRPGAFRDIATIYKNFFEGNAHGLC